MAERLVHRARWIQLILVFCLLLDPRPLQAAADETFARRELRASLLDTPPRIDGLLDDPVWQAVPQTSGFTRTYPEAGVPAGHDTRVQVGHDDENLYVAAHCLDPDPEGIVARLTRRDRQVESDSFRVGIDSRLDHRSGFYFEVNAAGVKRDGTYYDERYTSSDWDGVWTAAVARVADGWQVELRIPLSLLRYRPGPAVRMGIDFLRRHSRLDQHSRWQYDDPGSGREVSRFGLLTGLVLTRTPVHLEATPYLAARLQRVDGELVDDPLRAADLGVDARLGLGNLGLTATINPDFGQVEADRVVLNLSTVETYYAEKRPFFLEERERFQPPAPFGEPGTELFYTRRVGRPARWGTLEDGEELVQAPQQTRILGATKLVGRSEGGLSYGLIQAFTGAEPTVLRRVDGHLEQRVGEPGASYSVARLSQDFWDGSTAGLLLTSTLTPRDGAALTGGGDLQLNWRDVTLTALGQFSALSEQRHGWQNSYTEAALRSGGPLGHAGGLVIEQRGGKHLVGAVAMSWKSPNLALNDLGYQSRGDELRAFSWLQLRRLEPLGPLARASLNLFSTLRGNTAGLDRGQSVDLNGSLSFRGNWHGGGGLGARTAACDDRETRTEGRVAFCEAEPDFYGHLWLQSDKRTAISVAPYFTTGNAERGHWLYTELAVELRPTDWLELELTPGFQQTAGTLRWLETLEGEDGERFLFADTRSETWDLSLRGTLTFSPTLSLQAYAQLFHAVVDYRDRLVASGVGGRVYAEDLRLHPTRADLDDFSAVSLNSSVVLRWEYRPGSLLYLVYTGAWGDALDRADVRLQRRVQDLAAVEGDQVLMVKLSYRLD